MKLLNLFSSFLTIFALAQGSLTIASAQSAPSTSSTQPTRPKPTFFEETRRVTQPGFEDSFLNDALNGSSDPFGNGSGSAGRIRFQADGVASFTSQPQTPSTGVITRTGTDNISFSSGGTTLNIGGNLTANPSSVLINGVPATVINTGFVGNDAFATAVDANGQLYNVRVFNTGQQEPPVGTSFSGTVTITPAPDR